MESLLHEEFWVFHNITAMGEEKGSSNSSKQEEYGETKGETPIKINHLKSPLFCCYLNHTRDAKKCLLNFRMVANL